MEVKRRRPG